MLEELSHLEVIFATLPLNDGHTYREVQMVTKHKDPKTIMRYDHARENLDGSPVNSLSWDDD